MTHRSKPHGLFCVNFCVSLSRTPQATPHPKSAFRLPPLTLRLCLYAQPGCRRLRQASGLSCFVSQSTTRSQLTKSCASIPENRLNISLTSRCKYLSLYHVFSIFNVDVSPFFPLPLYFNILICQLSSFLLAYFFGRFRLTTPI